MNILPYKILKTLLALCLATPLLMSASFIFPYTAPKAFVFRILVEVAAVSYFYLALKYPANFFTPLFKGGRGGILNLSVLAFLLISFLSAIFGADFYTSWWGSLERMIGVWGLLHFVVWFFMLIAVFTVDGVGKEPPLFLKGGDLSAEVPRNGTKAEGGFKRQDFSYQLLQISVFTSAIISLLAIFQKFTSLGLLIPQADRVFSTIGNAGFLGTYLIFNIFLAGYLAIESIGKKRRLFIVCCLLLVVALFLSGTRGAYLGLLAGIISGIFLAIFFGEKKIKKYSTIFLITVFILFGLLFLFRDSVLVKNSPVLSRLTAFSLSDTTTQSRLLLWRESWRAWQERPLLGFGPENFEIAANKYFDARLAGYEAYGFDRAHNFIFDYGVASGWLGLLSYLAIMGAAGFALWRLRENNFIFFITFISLLMAYLVQNFFIFDSFVSYLMLFFVLALMSNVSLRATPPFTGERSNLVDSETGSGLPRRSAPRNDGLGGYQKIFLFMVILAAIFSLYSFNLKPILAAYRANQILSLPPADAARSASLLKDALALGSFGSAEVAYQAALDYIIKINQQPALAQNEEFYNIAAGELSKIIERSPNRARNYVALAWLNLYFSNQHPERINKSLNLADQILKLSPTKKDAYLILVAGYSLSGQTIKAQEVVSQAESIDVKMGKEVREYYEKLK